MHTASFQCVRKVPFTSHIYIYTIGVKVSKLYFILLSELLKRALLASQPLVHRWTTWTGEQRARAWSTASSSWYTPLSSEEYSVFCSGRYVSWTMFDKSLTYSVVGMVELQPQRC